MLSAICSCLKFSASAKIHTQQKQKISHEKSTKVIQLVTTDDNNTANATTNV
jgi:hypothetical protein